MAVLLLFLAATAWSNEPSAVTGRAAQTIYDVFTAKEVVSPRLQETVVTKMGGGLSCMATCPLQALDCSFLCRLKGNETQHVFLWNELRLPITENPRPPGGIREYFKEVGPLFCSARIDGGNAKFRCNLRGL